MKAFDHKELAYLYNLTMTTVLGALAVIVGSNTHLLR